MHRSTDRGDLLTDRAQPSSGREVSGRAHPLRRRNRSVLLWRGNRSVPLRRRNRLDYHKFVVEIAAIGVGLLTLVFLALQTVATREQVEEAANQVAAARLDGLYQQLVNWDEFRSSSENKRLNRLLEGDLKDVKNPDEKAQMYSALIWLLDYYSYVYETLPGLLECAPKDGRLVLRGSDEDTGKCEDWVAWSQGIHDNFNDKDMCQILSDFEGWYDRQFVAAIRDSGACPAKGPGKSGAMDAGRSEIGNLVKGHVQRRG